MYLIMVINYFTIVQMVKLKIIIITVTIVIKAIRIPVVVIKTHFKKY